MDKREVAPGIVNVNRVTEQLILRPTVWCDKCRMALFYARIGDGEEFLQHPPTKDCVRSEQKFKRQTIELERIE